MKSRVNNPPANSEKAGSQITDVALFFHEITEAYLDFTQKIRYLTDKIPAYSHQQLAAECSKLTQARDELAIFDQRMIDIITLAAPEITQDQMVEDYRGAFAKTVLACSTLHQKLRELKTTLEDDNRQTPIE